MPRLRNSLIGTLALGAVLLAAPGMALADADRTARTINRVEAQIIGLDNIADPRTRRSEIARLSSELRQLEALSANQGGRQARRNDARIDQLQDNLASVDVSGGRDRDRGRRAGHDCDRPSGRPTPDYPATDRCGRRCAAPGGRPDWR